MNPLEDLKEKLTKSIAVQKPLRIKVGFDPTSADLHLGHTVVLQKLRTFQDLGHSVHLIIGDFTARIGDPSGRSQIRPILSSKQILRNAQTYTDQAFKILRKSQTKVHFNSSWFEKMALSDFFSVCAAVTLARLVERDDFQERFNKGLPLSLLETIYPVVQAYDSVQIKADVEVGGTDQTFNLLFGRRLQSAFGQVPQVIVTVPLLEGTDGVQKMSKSLNNYIGIAEPPNDIFGKVMSLSDEMMYRYYHLLTSVDCDIVKKKHPRDAKVDLAFELTQRFYSKQAAEQAQEEFKAVFVQKELPQDMPQLSVPKTGMPLLQVLKEAHLVASQNEARRLIQQNAVSIDGMKISDVFFPIDRPLVIKVGKRLFLKIIVEE